MKHLPQYILLLSLLGHLGTCKPQTDVKTIKVSTQLRSSTVKTDASLVPRAYSSASGECQTAAWSDKLVVAARFEEDVSWMATYLTPFLPFLVYSISGDPDATHRTMSNTGREAQAYIQFIVDYYDCLPQYVAFVHGHHSSPHSVDIVSLLKRLKWSKIPGYVNLSNPPCEKSTFYFANPDFHKPADGDDSERAKWSQFAYEQNINIQAAWDYLFLDELGDLPVNLTSPGCGQFAVTREAILAHPRSFYENSLHWLRSTSMDTFWAGLVFEHTWSYVLGLGANYTAPAPCEYFTCDSEGAAITLPWDAAQTGTSAKLLKVEPKRLDRKAERRRVLARGRKMGENKVHIAETE